MAISSSLVVSLVQSSPGGGAICEKGTSTRFESMLALPILWTSCDGEFRLGRRIEDERGAGFGLRFGDDECARPRAGCTTLLLRSSSGTKPSGSGWRWSQWMSVKTPQRAPLAAMLCRRSRRGLAEARREIRDDEEVIFLRHAAGLLVVFGDRRVLVAQIHLDDLLDVLAELGEPLLDLVALRPDAAVDEALLVIAKVHEAGEILPEADRVDDREARPCRAAWS